MFRKLSCLTIIMLLLTGSAARADEIAVKAPGEKLSEIEIEYSKSAGQKLQQFGYDLFGVPGPETRKQLDKVANASQNAAQDEFVLHAGDELEITFTGQRTDHGFHKINADGVLAVPGLPPIPAEGRTTGQVRISVRAAAHNLHNTDADVSLSSVREIGVLVAGHVGRPGRQPLTVFHTVIDALVQAGGIDKDGSLRQIRLVRGGESRTIDLYTLLLHGEGLDLQLSDGDRIIVPKIGSVMAITGNVRPGIYELLPGEDRKALLAALGGVHEPALHVSNDATEAPRF